MTVVELTKSKKQTKRALTKQGETKPFQLNQQIKGITENQLITIDAWNDNQNLMLHGMPGTGKTFLALFLALKEVESYNSPYKKVVIIRSTVPTRNAGFLPGTEKEKNAVYEDPYFGICQELYGRKDAYLLLKNINKIEFVSTANLRGTTRKDAIVIVDEAQNMNWHELDTVLTRMGENVRISFCGDFRQTDLTTSKDKEGFMNFVNCLKDHPSFKFVEFTVDDIVRSELVKQYIIIKQKRGLI